MTGETRESIGVGSKPLLGGYPVWRDIQFPREPHYTVIIDSKPLGGVSITHENSKQEGLAPKTQLSPTCWELQVARHW